jgi:hypothetical protein
MATSEAYDREWRAISESARAAQPWCSWCGIGDGETWIDADGRTRRARLTVDHIDSDTTNRRPDNLRVLCDACHGSRTSDNWRR